MSAPGNVTGEKRQRAVAVMGNWIAVLGLLVLGYPLTPATIRMLLLGWVLIVAAVTRFAVRRRFQTAGSAVTIRKRVSTPYGLRMLPAAVDRQEMLPKRRRNHG